MKLKEEQIEKCEYIHAVSYTAEMRMNCAFTA